MSLLVPRRETMPVELSHPIQQMLQEMSDLSRPILDTHFGGDISRMDKHFQEIVDTHFKDDPFLPVYRRTKLPALTHQSDLKGPDNKGQVKIDVQQYTPDEISVRVVGDNVVVEGTHEEKKEGHGFVTRQFQRKYSLPAGTDSSKVSCNYSKDNVLTVNMQQPQLDAPKALEPVVEERIVPLKVESLGRAIEPKKKRSRPRAHSGGKIVPVEVDSAPLTSPSTETSLVPRDDPVWKMIHKTSRRYHFLLDRAFDHDLRHAIERFDQEWDQHKPEHDYITDSAGFSSGHIKEESNRYEVRIDVKDFRPEEVIVKVNDHNVQVEARHEEKRDSSGHVSRHLVRRYKFPSNAEPTHIVSRLSPDGLLIITAPKKMLEAPPGERIIPITLPYKI